MSNLQISKQVSIHSTARKHLVMITLIMAFAAFAVNAKPESNIAKSNIAKPNSQVA